jgi:lipopolysaccharide transport system permease protein
MSPSSAGALKEAFDDIREAFARIHIATIFGWQDVAQRYRRSRIGAFWLTINMGVMIGALGVIFGTLFRTPLTDFLPFICAGVIIWGFLSTCINEGCASFIEAGGVILQVRMPLFIHIMRVLWRNTIILGHNLIILPVVLLAVGKYPGMAVFLVLPGFLLVVFNVGWIMLVLAVVCTRFRDMTQVAQNFMQVLFYATPIVWMPSSLPQSNVSSVLELNPFYHLISLVRDPLLGQVPETMDWMIGVVLAIVGWAFALVFFGRYRRRVPYWL